MRDPFNECVCTSPDVVEELFPSWATQTAILEDIHYVNETEAFDW